MLALTIELGLMITCWAIRLLRYHFSTLNAADVLISTENAQRDKDGVKETKAEEKTARNFISWNRISNYY
jgi:hypothetical protein